MLLSLLSQTFITVSLFLLNLTQAQPVARLCANYTCDNNATCKDTVLPNGDASFNCYCINNTNPLCQNYSSACATFPCLHNGSCVASGRSSFSCVCATAWQGVTCSQNATQGNRTSMGFFDNIYQAAIASPNLSLVIVGVAVVIVVVIVLIAVCLPRSAKQNNAHTAAALDNEQQATMTTVKVIRQGSTGDWSLSHGIRSYLLCCLPSSTDDAEKSNSSDNKTKSADVVDGERKHANGHARKFADNNENTQTPGDNADLLVDDGKKQVDENKADVYKPNISDAEYAKPPANTVDSVQVVQPPAVQEHEVQQQHSTSEGMKADSRRHDGLAIESPSDAENVDKKAAVGTAKDDDSSSDEDGELVRQRFDRMSSRQQGSDKVKAAAVAVAETMLSTPPPEHSGFSEDEHADELAAMDNDPRLFDLHDLHGKGVDEMPPTASRCGSVQATLGYDHAKNSLLVTVIRASNVPTKERGGSDSSRVHVVVLEGSKKTREKTKIRTGDSPEFNETYRFKIAKDNVPVAAVRMRLYGCERLKRERLIGETLIRGESIDLVTGSTHWHNLEPQITVVRGHDGARSDDDASSLAKSDSGGSASSINSLQGGVPELLLSLAYNASTGRLLVDVAKGSNFRTAGSGRALDTYVKVQLLSFNGQEIARTKTSVRRGQPNPVFKESFHFQVASFQLNDVTLMVSAYSKKSMRKKEVMGWCSFGQNNSGDEEASHWNDMKESKGTHVSRWHTLLAP